MAITSAPPVQVGTGSPVHRFYNRRTGTHLYAISEQERQAVIAKWSDVFAYEGVAYSAAPPPEAGLDVPLYRFYSRRTGTHFYTASAEERDQVLVRWADTFAYEGVAYYVGSGGEGQVPLYRFYSGNTGTHFYTASAAERDAVTARWPGVFPYEGIAYYARP